MQDKKAPRLNWKNIAEDMAEGTAVLLLGPDAFQMHNLTPEPDKEEPLSLSFSALMRYKIRNNEDVAVTYFYERDNLFLFEDKTSKRLAKRTVCSTGKDPLWKADEALLCRIAEMKFPLVISINPDLSLRETYERFDIRHQFDYFSVQENKIEKPLDEITLGHPLIYNLCGSVSDPNSIILDYNDIFKLMQNLLSNKKFPRKLKVALKYATSYIFLGFQFDRWYFQMLLHYLNMLEDEFDTSSHNYSVRSHIREDDTRDFMFQQFNVKFVGADLAGFDELYQICRERKDLDLLRVLPNKYSDLVTKIRLKVANDNIEEALDLIEKSQTNIEPDMLALLRGRLRLWQKNKTEKTALPEYLDVMRNQIRAVVLDLAGKIS